MLSEERLERILGLARHARDFFLILLLLVTGMRVVEALGLRREDMHLLCSSRMLGCVIEGPHVHVRRRRENANGALAKSRFPRAIPVTSRLVTAYAEYAHERDGVAAAAGCDMVFVNLFREPLGAPMGYSSVKDLFDRLARAAGFAVRPHMLRHTAATGWVRAGVDLDVVRHLLGHVSSSSVQPYLHVNDRDMRDAVERVAAVRVAGRPPGGPLRPSPAPQHSNAEPVVPFARPRLCFPVRWRTSRPPAASAGRPRRRRNARRRE